MLRDLLPSVRKYKLSNHYNDVIMGAMTSQITSLTIVYSRHRKSKKTSKLCITGLCEGNSSVTDEFSAQRASNAENFSPSWRYHVIMYTYVSTLGEISMEPPLSSRGTICSNFNCSLILMSIWKQMVWTPHVCSVGDGELLISKWKHPIK